VKRMILRRGKKKFRRDGYGRFVLPTEIMEDF
jgi:hypothetical protein